MKRHWRLGAALLGAAMGLVAGGAAPVPVGAIEILSGPNAAYGTAIRNGLMLKLGEIEAHPAAGQLPITLRVEDSAGQKAQAINAARILIGRDHVAAIIGPTLSNEMFAVGPVTNGRRIPTIGTSTTAKGITDIGPYIFRTSLPEADVVPVTIRAAQQKFGVKTIALMYADDDAFSKSSFDVMRDAAQKAGLKVVAVESFGSRDTDFAPQLTRIKALKPDAVGIAALVEPTAGVLLQARQLGFGKETLFIGGNGANSPKLGQIAGAAADGLIVGSPWFLGKDDPANKAFVAAFRAKYGHDPDQFAAQAYDTMGILAQAIDRAGGDDPKRIRDALMQTDYQGVMGPFRFTAHRDPALTSGVVVLVMHGGAFQILK
ncbi:MAG TPA: ABC transporter substrate-binding protein [Acetobacteraceae bacterium]|nr:ABC transporter substrate-binding protein [Acetobacteraceae bacterium]